MRYFLPILAVALVLIVACTTPVLEKPNVTAVATNTGANLGLSWTAIASASGYYVYVDGVKHTVSATSYDVDSVAKLVEVSAYTGSTESDKWSLNTAIVKTTSVAVDNVNGSGANNAFYFNSSGTGLAIPLTQATDIDFVMDVNGSVTEMRSPDSYTPVYNSKDNASALATSTDFDAYTAAPASGVYNTVRELSSGALYGLWIDLTNNGWSTDDHFGKMKVEGISGNTLTLTLGYQKQSGLRWLK